jgi:hypothetical protein
LVVVGERPLLFPIPRVIPRTIWFLGSPVALTLAFAHLLVVFLILAVSVAWGSGMLERLGFEADGGLESLLFAAGFSFACLEIVLFVLAVAGSLSFVSTLGVLAMMALSAGRGWMWAWAFARTVVANASRSTSWIDRGLGLATFGFLAAEGLLAMAPVTGSDAMHYHFTVPLLEQGHGLVPIFWLTHSFFIGQGHLLISLGMVLGSDRVALGLLYLGGVLATGAVLALSKQLMPIHWAWIATLAFAATPMVFWQTSTSGSPDLWMAFFIPLAALAAARGPIAATLPAKLDSGVGWNSDRWWLLAGWFAGAAAGVKYTGWVIPLALVMYVLVTRRSLKVAVGAAVASLATGVWPLARNWVWTGDPVFPFLSTRLAPKLANGYGLAAITSVTSTEGFGRDAWHLLKFPFALVIEGGAYGLGQYFGPLVLAFAPLLIWSRWEKPAARVAALFWAVTFVSILLANQMGRFLLPVYPLALALVFSGVGATAERGWRVVTAGCGTTVVLFLLFSAGADTMYSKTFLPVVLGRETAEAFLRREAADYGIDEFIERALDAEPDRAERGRVMVFYRHLYYLRIPFVEGAPENSWLMDPRALRDPSAMLTLLRRLEVRWIVKTDEYPEALEPTLTRMEREGKLTPLATGDIQNLTGASRIYRETEKVHVTVMRVSEPP